jgi:hypothetical protein
MHLETQTSRAQPHARFTLCCLHTRKKTNGARWMRFTGDLSKDSRAIAAAEAAIQRQKRYNEMLHLKTSKGLPPGAGVAAAAAAAAAVGGPSGAAAATALPRPEGAAEGAAAGGAGEEAGAAGGVQLLSWAIGMHRSSVVGKAQQLKRRSTVGCGEGAPQLPSSAAEDGQLQWREEEAERQPAGAATKRDSKTAVRPHGVPLLPLHTLQTQPPPAPSPAAAAAAPAIAQLPTELARVADLLPAGLRSSQGRTPRDGSCGRKATPTPSSRRGGGTAPGSSARGGGAGGAADHNGERRSSSASPTRAGAATPHPAADEWRACASSALSSRLRRGLQLSAGRQVADPGPKAVAAAAVAAVPRLKLEAAHGKNAAGGPLMSGGRAVGAGGSGGAVGLLGPDALLPASARYLNSLTSARQLPPGQLLTARSTAPAAARKQARASARQHKSSSNSKSCCHRRMGPSNGWEGAESLRGGRPVSPRRRHGGPDGGVAALDSSSPGAVTARERQRRKPSPPPRLSYSSAGVAGAW